MHRLLNPPRKQKTREQVEKMKEKAAGFSRQVIGDEDKAQEFEDMSVEDYAQKKKVQLVNPARRREIVERALTHLPFHATSEERTKALRGAREAVQLLEPEEATELDILQAASEAVAVVATDCHRRHRRHVYLSSLPRFLPFGTSDEEEAEARSKVGTVLDSLPVSLSNSQVEEEILRELKPLIKRIELRERKKDLVRYGVGLVDTALARLYSEDLIDSEQRYDSELASDLRETIEEALEDELSGDENYADVQDRVSEIIEDELEVESDDED
ncbi:MAG: hypothetical protein LAN62_02125 [Acidobacteriia bacterium]|nr:hypothetical protein [Terriglobia bacterium]